MPEVSLSKDLLKPSVSSLEVEFQALAAQWRRDTGKSFMLHKIVLHPAYQKIIGMGEKELPFIFSELETRGGHWIWALSAITRNHDVARPEHTFGEAVQAWLGWRPANGHLY